ncbi:hypothetical protein SDC9_56161 [bioreactor metagenome]|uniref:Uncharacterized protein n=1 Tax=bioreactor metagenome TaxID=1076179 RepID=A0A644X237_9ZZZZ
MSAIIAVVGSNFCTFASDSRLVQLDRSMNNIGVKSDRFLKIFRINHNLIYGASGTMEINDDLLAPFSGVVRKHLTMSQAKNLVVAHMVQNRDILPVRNVLLGGKNEMGKFIIYEIQIKTGMDNPTVTLKQAPDKNRFAVSYTIPNKCMLLYPILQDNRLSKTLPWGTHAALVGHLEGLIKDLSEVDDSIGGDIIVESVM